MVRSIRCASITRLAHAGHARLRGPGLLLLAALVALQAAPLFSATARADCGEIDPVSLLPGAETPPGWAPVGPPRTAYTLTELTELINGGAYLYDAHGFVAAVFQDYEGTAGSAPCATTLAMFNQGTAENALALYNDPASGYGDAIPDWPGTGAARQREAIGALVLQFHEECFYASITVTCSGNDALMVARAQAEAILALLQSATPAPESTWGIIKTRFADEE
ncbi:MAG: hypothetical protein KAY32_06920 [Candidatus Eisenbacteria sp.]|nr:hypothetical protein [Candidatus Eisenbacteria bacterium]